MKKIYKYELPTFSSEIYEIPLLKILTVDSQNEKPYLWAIIDTNKELKKYKIIAIWTGITISDNFNEDYGIYLGTFVTDELVCHYFIKELVE